MSWGEEPQRALAYLQRAFDDHVAVAATTLDGDRSPASAVLGCAPDARFEIGSVTKTMTAVLLASLVAEGALALGDPVSHWLRGGRNGDVTVGELATHTSGLPRLAPNHRAGSANPYRRFTAARAERGLRRARRTTRGGFEYSNFGYQLLGLVLERASGQSYGELLSSRLLGPLEMRDTGVGDPGGGGHSSGAGVTRLSGHAYAPRPTRARVVPHWDFALPAPGGVIATIEDLGRYLQACLAPGEDPLGTAIQATQQPRARTDPHQEVGLSWFIDDDGLLHHTGATAGFSATVAVDRPRGRALGLLANTGGIEAAALLHRTVVRAVRGEDHR